MLQDALTEHPDLYHLSMEIIDRTVDFMALALKYSQDVEDNPTEQDELYQKADAIDALLSRLVNKKDPEIYTAMSFIADLCASSQQWELWNHIYGKLMYHALRGSAGNRHSIICLLPVNICVNSDYSGKSFRLSADERTGIEKSLHNYGLIPEKVSVNVLSDLMSIGDLALSPEVFHELAKAVLHQHPGKPIRVKDSWQTLLDPHLIMIPAKEQVLVETRFIVMALFDADSDDFGDLQQLWNTTPDELSSSEGPVELIERSLSWRDCVSELLPETLFPESLGPEPFPLALHSATYMLNRERIFTCLDLLNLDGEDVYCRASHYGDLATLVHIDVNTHKHEKENAPRPFGIMLHLYRKNGDAKFEILPYERVCAEFMVPAEMEAFRNLLDDFAIEFRGWLSEEQKKLCS